MKNIFAIHYYDTSKIMHSNQLEGLELAGFARRFFALLIDLFVLIITLYVIGTILDYFGLINFGLKIGISSNKTINNIPSINNNAHINVPEYLKIIFKLLIPVLYFGLITCCTNGYTFGKRIFKKSVLCFLGGIDINLDQFVLSARAGWDLQNNNGDGTSTNPRYKNVWYQATIGFKF